MGKEEDSFLAIEKELDWNDYALFTYRIETPINPKKAAVHICREQSTALWKRVGVDEDFRPKHGAKVVDLKVVGKTKPIFEFCKHDAKMHNVAIIKIAHPIINFGPKLPNLITAAAGEGAFFAPYINTVKLVDVELPEQYLKQFQGPKFGLEGIRKLMDVHDRPLITGVVKPNIGLKPEQFALIAYEALLGGADIVKDDEMLADTEYSPLKRRVECVIDMVNKAEDKTGERKMYLANITDEVDRILELHDMVAELGCHCVMLNTFTIGISAVRMLAKRTRLPIFAHFDFIATFTRIPCFGVSSELTTKIQRLAGCDAIIMPGFGARMLTNDEEVISNVNACLHRMYNIKKALPIPGGSDWAGTLPIIYEKLKTINFSMVLGRGVFGHPLGPEAGARSIRQAWEAIEKNVPLEEYAKTHNELKTALDFFGKKKE